MTKYYDITKHCILKKGYVTKTLCYDQMLYHDGMLCYNETWYYKLLHYDKTF